MFKCLLVFKRICEYFAEMIVKLSLNDCKYLISVSDGYLLILRALFYFKRNNSMSGNVNPE